MLIALWFGSSFDLAGQLYTQAPQPVQSSGATWTVHFNPLKSFPLASADLKVAGAPESELAPYTFILMVACGQTKEQMPHWMQTASSHTGMSTAMLRFSYCEVPVGLSLIH